MNNDLFISKTGKNNKRKSFFLSVYWLSSVTALSPFLSRAIWISSSEIFQQALHESGGKGDEGFPARDLALEWDSQHTGSDILSMKHCSDSWTCFPAVISSSDSIQYLIFP